MSLLDFFPSHFLVGAVLGIFNLMDNKSRLCFLAPWAGRSPYRLEAAAVLPQIRIVIHEEGGKGRWHSTDHARQHAHPPCPLYLLSGS